MLWTPVFSGKKKKSVFPQPFLIAGHRFLFQRAFHPRNHYLRSGKKPAKKSVLTPSVDASPPHQSQPFIKASFGPLTIGPPAGAELCVVASCGHRKRLSSNLATEDAERAASVVVRGDDEDSGPIFLPEAFFHIVGFLPSREPFNRTDSNRCPLRKTLNVFLGQLGL